MESYGVKIFGLIDSRKQNDFELIERILLEDRVLLEDLCAIGGTSLQIG